MKDIRLFGILLLATVVGACGSDSPAISVGVSAARQGARAVELARLPAPRSAVGADTTWTAPMPLDAGTGQLPDGQPSESGRAVVDGERVDLENAAEELDAGCAEAPTGSALPSENIVLDESRGARPNSAASLFEKGSLGDDTVVPVVAARTTPPSSRSLPLLGAMIDVGVPDGLLGSLAVRPWSWIRVSAGGGTNSISYGWRAGLTLLPLGSGPSGSLEYGRYQEGDANALAKRFVGGGFNGSPALDRIGYEYMNAHLGLDFGYRYVVFFLHGGVTMLRGQIHNLDATIQGTNAAGATEVVVRQDPNFKVTGPSLKMGLLAYIW